MIRAYLWLQLARVAVWLCRREMHMVAVRAVDDMGLRHWTPRTPLLEPEAVAACRRLEEAETMFADRAEAWQQRRGEP